MQTTIETKPATHKEMTTGVSGSGKTIYHVVTVCNVTGRWIHKETFKTLAEAKSWFKWA
jgi:hypothetical protein